MTAPPKWYKVVVIVALIWNLFGCMAVIMDLMIKPENAAKLSADQQTLYAARTTWSTLASLIAVLGGTIGSLGLVMRKTWSQIFLIASLIGLLVQNYGLFIVVDGARLAGAGAVILQSFVLLIAVGLIMLYRSAVRKEWISGSTGAPV